MIRPATERDDPALAAIALANGQPETDSGRDPRYTAHLRHHGTLLVAERDGRVTAFGATASVHGATMLTDLFVDPSGHGGGTGGRLLAALGPVDFTFASADPRATALYVRAGLTPFWPLLYLRGTPARLPAPTLPVTADLVVSAPGGEPVASGTGRLTRLTCPDPAYATDALTAVLHTVGPATLCLPGPHPALPLLLGSGYRITESDTFLSRDPQLLPTHQVYSPSLA